MIAELKPYPAMKDSGVEWLGEVPAHWDVVSNRALFSEIKDRGHSDEQMLSVTIKKGVIRQSELLEETSKKDNSNLDKSNYKIVRPGDIAYNKMRAWQGAIGVSSWKGIVSPAYVVQRPNSCANPGYFHELFRIPSFAKEAERWSYGIASDMWSLRPERFRTIYSCLPPLLEQTAIVRYLDYVGRRVRQFVGAKRKLIKLLEEQKQATIHHAVTRGLDPDAPLKDSGVEWLGKVPAHWEIQPLKYWVYLNKSVLSENTDADFEFEYLDIGSVGTGILMEKPQRIRFSTAPSRARRVVRDGDTLVSTVRTYLKAVWFADEINDCLIASTGFAVLSPNLNTAPKYVSYFVQSDSFTNRVTAESVGIAYPAISEIKLTKFEVAIPPLSEQTMIVDYLDKATASIDATITRTRREIELLQEYHTRLTADVVTGKVDVRNVAENLPDEVHDSADIPETESDLAVEESQS